MSKRKGFIATKGDYTLFVGTESDGDNLSYKIINDVYDVIEAETRILPQAHKFLEDLSAALDVQIELMNEDNNKPVPGPIRLIKKDDQL